MKKKGAQLRRALSVVELVQAETGDQGFRGAKSVPIVRLMPEILEARRLGYSRAVIWRVLTKYRHISISKEWFRKLCKRHEERAGLRARRNKVVHPSEEKELATKLLPWEPDLEKLYGAEE